MGNHKQTVVFPPFPVELDRKSQALSCDIAASAMLRPCASPLVSVGPAELPAGFGRLGAEDGLVKNESIGQGGEGYTVEAKYFRFGLPPRGDQHGEGCSGYEFGVHGLQVIRYGRIGCRRT